VTRRFKHGLWQPQRPLTDHQRRVWALVAEGRSHTEIAHAMGSSTGAVKQDVARIKDKLGVDTTEQLKIAYRWVADR
jgi:DNA-binding NarL/FixJ family response regulator